MKIKLCYDNGTCRNEDTVENLIGGLRVAVIALHQYANGKTWRHIATDALRELEQRGLINGQKKKAQKEAL